VPAIFFTLESLGLELRDAEDAEYVEIANDMSYQTTSNERTTYGIKLSNIQNM
jgi:hypothetical protein